MTDEREAANRAEGRIAIDLDPDLTHRMDMVHKYEKALARRLGKWDEPQSSVHALIMFAWARLQYRLETYGSLAAAVQHEAAFKGDKGSTH